MEEKRILIGRDTICRHYQFGRQTFYWLIEQGAPIRRLNGTRYFMHIETFEAFMLELTKATEPPPAANRRPLEETPQKQRKEKRSRK